LNQWLFHKVLKNFKMNSTLSFQCTKVNRALEFLGEVEFDRTSDIILKHFLMQTTELTADEIDITIASYKHRSAKSDRKNHRPRHSRARRRRLLEQSDDSEFFSTRNAMDLSFLKTSKQRNGQQLVEDFLNSEEMYCSILETLMRNYYPLLARFASQRKLQISRKEVDEIFYRIPALLRFHKGFLLDLKRGFSTSRLFLRMFDFFEGYTGYMRECDKMMGKMREHIGDTRLYFCLQLVRQHSGLPNRDMMDLLLTPLDRMVDYKNFLYKLLSWSDETQVNEYELISKAARRVGRVTNYIDRYKFGIFNHNEMIKIQSFLKNQYDIFSSERVIIHSGMMISHTPRWTSRKKRCIFFLFSDIFMKTRRNGVLLSIIRLDRCWLTPSTSRRWRDRKFELTYHSKKSKVLKLECTNIAERDEWYEALKATISAAKDNSSELRPTTENSGELKEESSELSMGEHKSSEIFDTDSSRDTNFASEHLHCSYTKSFSGNARFRAREFEDPNPMDLSSSKISDMDVKFYIELKNCIEEMMPVRSNWIRRPSTGAEPTSIEDNESSRSVSSVIGNTSCIWNRNQSREVQGDYLEFFHQRRKGFECFHKLDRNNSIIQGLGSNLDMEVESQSVYQVSLGEV